MADPWTRRVDIGPHVLLEGDCLAILPHLEGIGAVLSDPPYGIAHRRGVSPRRGDRGLQGGAAASLGASGIANDERLFDPTPWLQWPCLLWGADHFAERLPRGRWLIWDKTLGGGAGDFSEFEVAWFSKPGAARIFRHLWMGVQRASQVGEARQHPTEKPVALLEWCLGFLPDAVTLDPFMGSGTTGVACVRKGRRFIGVEIDPQHFETAVRRVRDAYAQPDLLTPEPPATPVQEVLF